MYRKLAIVGVCIAAAMVAMTPLAAVAAVHETLAVLQFHLSPDMLALVSALMIGRIDLKELRDQRGKLVHDAREILEKAETEKRDLNAEEQKTWDDLIKKQDEVRSKIEREERMADAERQAAEDALRRKEEDRGDPSKKGDPEKRAGVRGSDEYRDAFNRFLAQGRSGLSAEELRALQADSGTAGGYTVASEQFVDQLIKFVDNAVLIRQRATKFPLASAQSMGAPSLDNDPADADWTSELATGGEDSTMSFGKRELMPKPLAKRIKVSNKLLRQAPRADSLVMSRLAYKFGVSQEKGFMTGSGVNQPLGVFTASALGISTGRDISTGNGTTAPTIDGLISAKYGLKPQYWGKAEWMFHRDVISLIAKLKDGEGQYLWRESVLAGEPDRILNLPIAMSEYAPNTLTTGLYVGILGDFSNYWIADALDLQVQRLVELYAETDQTGFIGRLETDGMPVLEEAFVRVKLG